MVTTNRFTSALATIISAVAAWLVATYFVDNQAGAALVGVIASTVTGLLIPAAAAPVGTIDATVKPVRQPMR